jgi:hypothetical protein
MKNDENIRSSSREKPLPRQRECAKKNDSFGHRRVGKFWVGNEKINLSIIHCIYMLTFFYRKLASNLVMLIARHLLFYGLYNTENVMNEITHLPDSQKKYV